MVCDVCLFILFLTGCIYKMILFMLWVDDVCLDLTDDTSSLVEGMAWYRHATSHFLHQCCTRSTMPYGILRPQWVNHSPFFIIPRCCPSTQSVLQTQSHVLGWWQPALQISLSHLMAVDRVVMAGRGHSIPGRVTMVTTSQSQILMYYVGNGVIELSCYFPRTETATLHSFML